MRAKPTDRYSIKTFVCKCLNFRVGLLSRQHKTFKFFGFTSQKRYSLFFWAVYNKLKFIFRNDARAVTFSSFSFSLRPAFTLAEVLIVLGIIGIIAEMTIPTLMNNVNQQDIKVGVKTAYSIMSQAALMAANDNGGTLANICSNDYDNVCMKNYMAKYLQTIKDCGGSVGASSTNNPTTNGCWITSTTLTGGVNNEYNNYAGMVLKNGMFVVFRAHKPDCVTAQDTCGWMGIDVNGAKPPNKQGLDTFSFGILLNGTVLTTGDIPTGNCYIGVCGSETSPQYLGVNCAPNYLYGN